MIALIFVFMRIFLQTVFTNIDTKISPKTNSKLSLAFIDKEFKFLSDYTLKTDVSLITEDESMKSDSEPAYKIKVNNHKVCESFSDDGKIYECKSIGKTMKWKIKRVGESGDEYKIIIGNMLHAFQTKKCWTYDQNESKLDLKKCEDDDLNQIFIIKRYNVDRSPPKLNAEEGMMQAIANSKNSFEYSLIEKANESFQRQPEVTIRLEAYNTCRSNLQKCIQKSEKIRQFDLPEALTDLISPIDQMSLVKNQCAQNFMDEKIGKCNEELSNCESNLENLRKEETEARQKHFQEQEISREVEKAIAKELIKAEEKAVLKTNNCIYKNLGIQPQNLSVMMNDGFNGNSNAIKTNKDASQRLLNAEKTPEITKGIQVPMLFQTPDNRIVKIVAESGNGEVNKEALRTVVKKIMKGEKKVEAKKKEKQEAIRKAIDSSSSASSSGFSQESRSMSSSVAGGSSGSNSSSGFSQGSQSMSSSVAGGSSGSSSSSGFSQGSQSMRSSAGSRSSGSGMSNMRSAQRASGNRSFGSKGSNPGKKKGGGGGCPFKNAKKNAKK